MRGTPTRSFRRRWTSSKTTSRDGCSTRPWRFSDARQATGPREPTRQRGNLDAPPARAQGPATRLRVRDRGRDGPRPAYREGLRVGARRRGAVDGIAGGSGQRPRFHPQVAPTAPGPARHPRAGLPTRPVDGTRGAHPGPAPAGGRSEEHTSELQSLAYLVCRLLLEKKKKNGNQRMNVTRTLPGQAAHIT